MIRIEHKGKFLENINEKEFLYFAKKYFNEVKNKDGLIGFDFEEDE